MKEEEKKKKVILISGSTTRMTLCPWNLWQGNNWVQRHSVPSGYLLSTGHPLSNAALARGPAATRPKYRRGTCIAGPEAARRRGRAIHVSHLSISIPFQATSVGFYLLIRIITLRS